MKVEEAKEEESGYETRREQQSALSATSDWRGPSESSDRLNQSNIEQTESNERSDSAVNGHQSDVQQKTAEVEETKWRRRRRRKKTNDETKKGTDHGYSHEVEPPIINKDSMKNFPNAFVSRDANNISPPLSSHIVLTPHPAVGRVVSRAQIYSHPSVPPPDNEITNGRYNQVSQRSSYIEVSFFKQQLLL